MNLHEDLIQSFQNFKDVCVTPEIEKLRSEANTYRATATSFAVVDTKEGSALAHKIYGMSVQDGTPTPTSPVDIESAKADFKCTGKNLIPYPYVDTSKTQNGITFTVQADHGIQITGTATANTYFNLGVIPVKKGVSYSLTRRNDNVISGSVANLQLYDYYGEHTTRFATTDNNDTSVRTLNIDVILYGRVNCLKDRTYNCVVYPVFTISTDLSYEPNQHKDITTDLTLRAIEVSSTDEYNLERDGKYYIADTVDWSENRGYEITRRVSTFDKSDFSSSMIHSAANDTENSLAYRWTVIPDREVVMLRDDFVPMLANYFVAGANRQADDLYTNFRRLGGTYYSIGNHYLYLELPTSIATTQDAQNWVNEHDLVFYYTCVPYTEPITSEQAQTLLSLKTYDEASYITSTSNVEPVTELEYSKTKSGAKALTGHNEGYIAQELESVYGVKNLIPFPYYAMSKTGEGLVYTVDDDGSITINGTSTQESSLILVSVYQQLYLEPGIYKVTLPEGTQRQFLRIYDDTNGVGAVRLWDYNSTGNMVVTQRCLYHIALIIRADETLDNKVFHPMIRPASVQSNEYQPYAMSNYELTKLVKELQTALLEMGGN